MKRKEIITEKQEKLKDLDNLVSDLPNLVSRADKERAQNLQFKLEFQLNELVEKAKIEELDLKIKMFKKLLKIFKPKIYVQ